MIVIGDFIVYKDNLDLCCWHGLRGLRFESQRLVFVNINGPWHSYPLIL